MNKLSKIVERTKVQVWAYPIVKHNIEVIWALGWKAVGF